jgi:hypothetical protein
MLFTLCVLLHTSLICYTVSRAKGTCLQGKTVGLWFAAMVIFCLNGFTFYGCSQSADSSAWMAVRL